MGNVIKWASIGLGALVILIVAALLIIPMFLDARTFLPGIEKRVSEATGRPFEINGDFKLSLFPNTGLRLSDLRLGNAEGFQEKDFVSVKSVEIRLKLLPLISRDVQIKRFIIESPRIYLEKAKNGRGNWEGMFASETEESADTQKEKEKPEKEDSDSGLPIKKLAVGDFSIKDGLIQWFDHNSGNRQEVKNLTIKLKDVSLDEAIEFTLSAEYNDQPVSLKGRFGPVGEEPGQGTLPLDLSFKLSDIFEAGIKGSVEEPGSKQFFNLSVDIAPFSLRKLFAAFDRDFPVETADAKVLERLSFRAQLEGDPEAVTIKNGILVVDDSKLVFSGRVRDFSKPDVAFKLSLDQIDLDKYLPPAVEKKEAEAKKEEKPLSSKKEKTNYEPLRKLVLDGTIKVGKLKVKNASMQNVSLKVRGRNGLFKLDPISLELYQGKSNGRAELDVRQDIPVIKASIQMAGVSINPLLVDTVEKDILEGTIKADVSISMTGQDAEKIKRTLNGRGDLKINDGAIKGIDLANMVRNVKSAFGLAEKAGDRPRTDFSELFIPFTLTNGIFNTPGVTLMSPLIRVINKGQADLVKETLNFRVEPKVVATIKGQDDTMARSGIMVPVLVGGTFSDPTFRPDLKALVTRELDKRIPGVKDLEKIIPAKDKPEETIKTLEETGKKLLKGLFK